jgi:alkanesulfonate monooxygenase SsuD/methylene tetrahydromethanopterin reductase-like flavin-dependent oxidoreductase (luciferase family)
VRFGIYTALEDTTFGALQDLWRAADEIDVYEFAWANDHFMPVRGDRTGPCLESWVALSALAHATSRLRVGSLINAMIYRHPAVLAKMAATLDIVSGGRLELSLGTGWSANDCTSYGIDLFPLGERFDRFEEGCQVIISLLTKELSNFEGQFFQLSDAPCEPKPIQRPHPPIVIGGAGPKRTLRAVARYGDHWNYPFAIGLADPRNMRDSTGSVDEWRRLRDILAERCIEIGRDPATITT